MATCCRNCLAEWHAVPVGRGLPRPSRHIRAHAGCPP
ncbi:DUF4186 family protein [Methylobacterium sp. WL64]|nr:DUF4186 family protein [Methylobacterium sp. WL64]